MAENWIQGMNRCTGPASWDRPAPATTHEAIRVKVERACPRCRVVAYHLGNDGGVPHRMSCVNCGHIWTGRIRKDEQK